MTASLRVSLDDLQRLCDLYVPHVSRHSGSFDTHDAWWPAHELGHLLIATRREIGKPMFGIDDSDALGYPLKLSSRRHTYLLTMECAAMTISAQLLTAAGRADLAAIEYDGTDRSTITWWDDHPREVTCLLEQRRAHVPCESGALEQLLQHARGSRCPKTK